MDNAASTSDSELTCAWGCRYSRVYVGTTDGSISMMGSKPVHYDGSIPAVAANGSSESDGNDRSELTVPDARWRFRLFTHAVTSLCGYEEQNKGALLLVGSAAGELVVLREELELRRYQLESAVQYICLNQIGEFIVGDMLGNLYGVTPYEICWKSRMPSDLLKCCSGKEYYYPSMTEPSVVAIVHAKLLDVEKTLSNYVLVAAGQKYLLVTHRGKKYSVIRTSTPIATLTSFSFKKEDVVLAAGEEGVIYRLVNNMSSVSKEMIDFQFYTERWAQVSFPIVKLVTIETHASSLEMKPSTFAWMCLGFEGEVALFHGRECVKEWNTASFGYNRKVDSGMPVDLAVVGHTDAKSTQHSGVIVFPERMLEFSLD